MFYAFNLKKYTKALKFLIVIILVLILSFLAMLRIYPINNYSTILKYSDKYDLEPSLVCAVIKTESGFDQYAVSNKGASGLMQIMEPTAKWAAELLKMEDYTHDMIFDPEINIEIGCWHLSRLIKQYDGNLQVALAAYNAGGGNVSKWLKNEDYSKDGYTLDKIPFGETEKYVEKINRRKKIYEFLIEVLGGFYAKD